MLFCFMQKTFKRDQA